MAVSNSFVSVCIVVFCALSLEGAHSARARYRRQSISYDQELTSMSFPEDSSQNTILYDFNSLQIEGQAASSFTFSVVKNKDSRPPLDTVFSIDSQRRVTFADGLSEENRSKNFDYEQYPQIVITVEAVHTSDVDGNDKKLIKLTIPLEDVNDELPVLENKPVPYLTAIPERPKEEGTIYELLAEDPDTDADIVYSIDASKAGNDILGLFRMDQMEEGVGADKKVVGHIKISTRTQLTKGTKFDIPVRIEDQNGRFPQIISANVEVLVGPRAPQFFEEKYKGSIFETKTPNNPVNTRDDSSNELVVKVRSFQGDLAKTFEVLEDNNQKSSRFSIDNNGKIVNKEPLDYDIEVSQRPPIFNLIIKVIETLVDGTTLESTVPLEILVKDENDNPPRFQYSQYQESVLEDTAIGNTILEVLVEDDDSGKNAEVTYKLDDPYFAIQRVVRDGRVIGAVTVKENLDYDAAPGPIYRFLIFAEDGGTPSFTSSVDVIITTSNVNDGKPIIQTPGNVVLRDQVDVSKNPFFLTRIRAQDTDGDGVQFFLDDNGEKVRTKDIFKITPSSGVIEVFQSVPLGKDSYLLKVIAEDDGKCCPGNVKKSSSIEFLVEIVDSVNQKPTFDDCLKYKPSFKEESPPGTNVVQVSATDNDRGLNKIVRYTIISPNPSMSNAPFQINATTGQITIKSTVDRELENANFIQVTVKATDQGESPQDGWCTFRVEIEDINDNDPVFNTQRYTQEVSSKTAKGRILLRVGASDRDISVNADLKYSLVDDGQGVFGIYPESGLIYLKENFKAGQTKYTLLVKAEDQGDPVRSGDVEVVITITSQEASTPPQFDDSARTYTVAETAPTGTFIAEMKCVSKTESDPRVQFFLVSEDGQLHSQRVGKFSIRTPTASSNEVSLYVADDLDYETAEEHSVTLRCQNFAALTMYEQIVIKIKVQDKNDEVPTFPGWIENGRYQAGVLENQPPGAIVIKDITASDRDISSLFNQVTYSIDNSSYVGVWNDFSIETQEGKAEIRTKKEFNREVKERYILIVTANDISPSDLPQAQPGMPNSATVVVQVTIEDENDNPMYFKQDLYNHTVKETANIGYNIFPVTADDPDEVDQGKLLYSFDDPNAPFDIRDRTGDIFVTGKLDYETEPREYRLKLTSRDSLNKYTATTEVMITLTDENDNIPVFKPDEFEVRDEVVEEDASISPENPYPLVLVTAIDKDTSRTKQIRYNLLGEGTEPGPGQLFTINSDSGQIFLIATLDRDKPRGKAEYIFTVEALDEEVDPQKGYANVKVFPKDINDNKPVFDRASLSESIPENLEKGSFVAQVKATDADFGNNALLFYDIIKSPSTIDDTKTNYFSIAKNGRVTTQVDKSYLDRETMPFLEVLVRVTDQGSNPLSDTATLTIRLLDENDNAPEFDHDQYNVVISEHTTSGVILDVQATDADINENAVLTYGIDDNDHFKIDTVNNKGYISIIPNQQKPIDYENPDMRNFLLEISVRDKDPDHLDRALVNITVEDFNDEVPKFIQDFQEVRILEGELPGRNVTTFTAVDRDSGINAELSYTILRSSDPRREFYIDEDSGVVLTRKTLDREMAPRMEVIILAIDKGDPQLTGSATMVVTVLDINDNYPIFKEDYQPVVMENGGPSDLPLEIFAKDLDTNQFGPPFGFALPTNCDSLACQNFDLVFDEDGDDGDGKAVISSKTATFDREEHKYYELPIVMWDMRGSGDARAQTGTNTLTITIGDQNDNRHGPGHQDVFVYNYKGTFGPLVIGRVYVEDRDDWDLPDKTFNFISPSSLQSYFSVDLQTGDITMMKGVVSNFGKDPYTFSVSVYDKHFDATVVSTVSVTVMDLTEEAVANSGGVRFQGITASEFILEPVDRTTGKKKESLYTQFRNVLADKLQYPVENVEIVNLRDGDDYLEVRYSAHGSPYLSAAELDNIVIMNQAAFEDLGLTVGEVPIDECLDEIFEGGCYNKLTITGNPVTVNANGTSYVGVEAFMVATQGCEADVFPESNECTGDYCHNGGQCEKDDWGNLRCKNCPSGYTGARCQETRHSFDGDSVAMYRTLTQCEESQTSIEFITEAEDGVLFYNGPLRNVDGLQTPADFIILNLKGGYPLLRIDHGTGIAELALDGKDKNGRQLLQKLNDGKWHHIDINRRGKEVELVVDRCAVAETSVEVVEDDRACRIRKETPGVNMYLNVNTLLQLGGLMLLENNVNHLNGLVLDGFDGCLRDFVHNKRLYDLHVKELVGVNTGKNGCPREDLFCKPNNVPRCGPNGVCEATLSGAVTCICDGGYWGAFCDKEASVRDYVENTQTGETGYYVWEMKNDLFNSLTRHRDIKIHIMFRTRQREGALVVLEDTSSSTTQHIRLVLSEGRVKLMYNLGEKDKELVLANSTADDGQWHSVSVERYGTEFHLKMDNGEGRNYAYVLGANDGKEHAVFKVNRDVYSGSYKQSKDRLVSTCVQDVRINNGYFAMTAVEGDDPDAMAEVVENPDTRESCKRDGDCTGNKCARFPNTQCFPLWEDFECRCKEGYHGPQCVSTCIPNPCYRNATCVMQATDFVCQCPKRWTGKLCNELAPEEVSSAGVDSGVIIAIIVSIIVVIVLALLVFLVYVKLCNNGDDGEKYILEVDPEDDIRENVMNYDEEGAGEKDQDAYDISRLQGAGETLNRPYDPDRRKDITALRNAPGGDKPDVGNFIDDRMRDADHDDGAPPHDSVREFNFEGGDSEAGSLSSLNTSSSDRSQDYDYLNEWGPKFSKLADMYGAGQDLPTS